MLYPTSQTLLYPTTSGGLGGFCGFWGVWFFRVGLGRTLPYPTRPRDFGVLGGIVLGRGGPTGIKIPPKYGLDQNDSDWSPPKSIFHPHAHQNVCFEVSTLGNSVKTLQSDTFGVESGPYPTLNPT